MCAGLSRASRNEMARPIPRLPPVTSTTFPERKPGDSAVIDAPQKLRGDFVFAEVARGPQRTAASQRTGKLTIFQDGERALQPFLRIMRAYQNRTGPRGGDLC